MGYTVAEMFNLFQFNEGLNGIEVCRQTGIKSTQIHFAKSEDVLTKKTNELMVKQFGENWNSVENLRKYQEKKNIVDNDVDNDGQFYFGVPRVTRSVSHDSFLSR